VPNYSSSIYRLIARAGRAVSFVGLLAALGLAACDTLFTSSPGAGDVLDGPLPGLTPGEAAVFLRGDAEFERRFSPNEGLGPIFNDVSCASCHSADGRGVIENALDRIGTADDDMMRAIGGPQIQNKAIAGATVEQVPAGVFVSRRLPPPVFGVGLIEAIPQEAILALADPDDRDGDGISGRPNMVAIADFLGGLPGAPTGLVLGRFGRKAQTADLTQQVTEAYHQDMGITSDFLPIENVNPFSRLASVALDRVADPELPASTVHAVTTYVRLLAPPDPTPMTPQLERGRMAFTASGCGSCHVPELTTGPHEIAALAHRPVRMFSDLLLHDMGDALADRRPDGQATGTEWKTPPLWGLRLMRAFLNGQALLMHDGRARSVEEAILLHAGEGARARDAFAGLSAADRRALLDYVESR
jgi:CxxC motif-containing protein (DUF1111 family)